MKTMDFKQFMDGDRFAVQIAEKYSLWKESRSKWEEEAKELRNHIFATSTKTTENAKLPWKNSTTLPKLTQIRDNLHANYISALFPNEDWLTWVAEDSKTLSADAKAKVEAFMKNRLRESKFEETMDRLILDYIDYGNAFAGITYVDERIRDEAGEVVKEGYVGPKLYRISPFDIVFDPTATSFKTSPKITRTLISMGELESRLRHGTAEEKERNEDILTLVRNKRLEFQGAKATDIRKVNGYVMDGFSDMKHYFGSGMVEVLEFEGTLYDIETGELLEDHIVTIVDRSYIVRKQPIESYMVGGHKAHVGWRKRPDNIYAQGPLDKLVGMQYRIDHLENLRADAFDFIAYPMIKVQGEVQDFELRPHERIYIGADGDVGFLHPDTTVLAADAQIQQLEMRMEEYAGAPKEAMGIRTPGEKTAFEVQQLQNAAGRIFQAKITQFEKEFVEPLVNNMFEMAKRNLSDGAAVTQRALDEAGFVEFITIRPTDIEGSGKFYPRGARHFAAVAKATQDLNNFFMSPLGQDQSVRVHFSGKELAKLMNEILGFDKYKLYQENVMITEAAQTQRLQQAAQQRLAMENQVDVEGLDAGAEAGGIDGTTLGATEDTFQ